MPSGPDLARTQRLLWDLIAAPEGVAKGMQSLRDAGRLGIRDLSEVIRGDDRLGAEERLDIYANMYFYRLRDCLAEDFPKVVAIAGGAAFHNLITDYLLAHPSSSWTLRDLGTELPGFLDEHALAREHPFLPDLARLEWARIDVFDEADAVPLSREAMAELPPDEVDELRLGLVPACRLLTAGWSVAAIWRQVDEAEEEPDRGHAHSASLDGPTCALSETPLRVSAPDPGPTLLRVWRKGFRVHHRTISPAEGACLDELASGATLPRLCDRLLEADPDLAAGEPATAAPEAATHLMAELLATWLADGILIAS